jgi:superfamily I DNA/RNA helicase
VARVAWLVVTGIDPATIAAITFNARAAEELAERLGPALEPSSEPHALPRRRWRPRRS